MNELCILQDDVPPFPNQVGNFLSGSAKMKEFLRHILLLYCNKNWNLEMNWFDNCVDSFLYYRGGTWATS